MVCVLIADKFRQNAAMRPPGERCARNCGCHGPSRSETYTGLGTGGNTERNAGQRSFCIFDGLRRDRAAPS
jgi:hypothetical protein